MMANGKPVEATIHKEFFEDVDANTIIVLNKDSALRLWMCAIDEKAPSYFRLPDQNWIVSNNNNVVGEWREAYNLDDNLYVANLLQKKVNWTKDSTVRFYISKSIVLETKWDVFLKHWDDFLALEDDCPILIKEGDENARAILFRANGDIVLVTKQQSNYIKK
jgi:hypothetical protein